MIPRVPVPHVIKRDPYHPRQPSLELPRGNGWMDSMHALHPANIFTRRSIAAVSRKPCVNCACQRRRVLQQNGLSSYAGRPYSRATASPKTRAKTRRERPFVVTREQIEERRQAWLSGFAQVRETLSRFSTTRVISVNLEVALSFLDDLDVESEAPWSNQPSSALLDVSSFEKVRKKHSFPVGDCWVLSQVLMKDSDFTWAAGWKVLKYSSQVGSEYAVLTVVELGLIESNSPREMLKKPAFAGAFARLQEMVKKGENYHALALAGKCAYTAGQEESAIRLWTQAIELFIADPRAERGKQVEYQDAWAKARNLSSPWIDLTNLHLKRKEDQECAWAIKVGCDQEEPTSHYLAALLQKEQNQEGQHIGTSGWLYHMTKAASSGYVKACHQLGIFYAQSGWKYIEDEPPDHVKPTPFDSYPPDFDASTRRKRSWDQIRISMGLQPTSEPPPHEQIFHTAAFPATPEARMQLALFWLKIAIEQGYAPSHLFAARLLLEKTLWSQAAAPKEALQLSTKRYTYASQSDFDAFHPISQPGAPEPPQEEAPIPNPHYDSKAALSHLAEVMNAAMAQRASYQMLADVTSERQMKAIGGDEVDDIFVRKEIQDGLKEKFRKWFRYPEIRQMYSDDENGVLFDDALDIPDLDAAAKRLCDEHHWDAFAPDGFLLYRHKPAMTWEVKQGETTATG